MFTDPVTVIELPGFISYNSCSDASADVTAYGIRLHLIVR